MESIISALCTPNELLIRNTNFIFIAIEAVVSMLLFTSVLNIDASRKTKVWYLITFTILSSLVDFLLPQYQFLTTIILFVCIYCFFKVSLIKTFIAVLIPFILTVLLESCFSIFSNLLISVPYIVLLETPIYLFIFRLLTYIIEFIMCLLIKKLNLNIKVLDNITQNSKKIIISNLLLGIIFVLLQISMFDYYAISIPTYMAIINIFILISYFILSIYSLTKTSNLESAKQRIENLELYNKTLNLLHDNIRAFKHDFNNIVQAIGRICCDQ